MSAVTKGWIVTGVYCAIALTPGVNLMLAFLLAWGMLVTFVPALTLIQGFLGLFGARPPDWLALWLAIVVLGFLAIGPTLRTAWRTAPHRRRWRAIAQTAAMWAIGIGSSFLAARALDQVG